MHALGAGVEQREAAGAVGRLHHARREAALPDGRRLLVAGDAANADRAAEQIGLRLAEVGRAVAHLAAAAPSARRTAGSRSSSQSPRPISNSSVRDALVASVAWTLPPVSRQSRNESTVPNASRPCSAAARAPVHMVEQPADLGRRRNTDRAPGRSWPRPPARARRARSAAQASAVRRSCQTMALWIGLPLARSQTIVVSRWLVMPMPAMSLAPTPALAIASRTVATTRRPDFLRIVLDPSRRRIDLPQFLLRDRDRSERCVEHDRPRRGGALVDGDESGRQARPRHGGAAPIDSIGSQL